MSQPPRIEWDALPEAVRKQINLTKEQFEEMQARMAERDARTPAVGTPAPDFELKRLTPDGELTDETLRLSSLRGRPVALVFGSYT